MYPRPRRLALLVSILTLAGASSALAAPAMEVAVQDDNVLARRFYGNPTTALKLARKLKATRIRTNVVWSYVVGRAAKKRKAPKRIRYNWTGYDALLRKAQRRGMRLQLTLTGPAPAWATSNRKVGPMRPKAKAFKAFARAAALHFRGRVDRYSIWNEPSYVGWLAPLKAGPKLYRGLYTVGYNAIKRVDPSAKVFIAETSPYALRKRATAPLKFLRGVTCANASYGKAGNCAPLLADGFAHHPYDFKHAPGYKYPGRDNVTLATLGRLTTALDKLHAAGLLRTPAGGVPELYLTEYGYFSAGKGKVSKRKHAKYLVKAFTMAQANPRVRQMLQYLILKPRGNFRHFDTSIADKRGKPSLAFKKLAAWAKAAAAAGRVLGTLVSGPSGPSGGGGAGGQPPAGGGGSGGSGGGGGGSPPPSCAPLPVCP